MKRRNLLFYVLSEELQRRPGRDVLAGVPMLAGWWAQAAAHLVGGLLLVGLPLGGGLGSLLLLVALLLQQAGSSAQQTAAGV